LRAAIVGGAANVGGQRSDVRVGQSPHWRQM
jgi:hypothetical protein